MEGRGWVEAARLIGLFWAALAHPGRISSLSKFRLAALCLAVSLVVPALFLVFPIGPVTALAIPPVLTMLAVILAVGSVMPRRDLSDAEPGTPADRPRD